MKYVTIKTKIPKYIYSEKSMHNLVNYLKPFGVHIVLSRREWDHYLFELQVEDFYDIKKIKKNMREYYDKRCVVKRGISISDSPGFVMEYFIRKIEGKK